MGWDPGTEIRDRKKPVRDPGSRGQKGTGSRIRIRNTLMTKKENTVIGVFHRKNFSSAIPHLKRNRFDRVQNIAGNRT
jgi:hypothetical protein